MLELLQDDSGILTTTERQQAIQHALQRYSKDRPREVVDEVSGDGGFDYALPTATSTRGGWIEGFSQFVTIEPARDDNAQNRSILQEDEYEYELIRKTTGQQLRFLRTAPSSGDTIRRVYTTLHSLTSSGTTIYEADFYAFVNLGASYAARMIAARFQNTTDAQLTADVVNYGSRADQYRTLARDLAARYWTHMGIDPDEERPRPSTWSRDWDVKLAGVRPLIWRNPRIF